MCSETHFMREDAPEHDQDQVQFSHRWVEACPAPQPEQEGSVPSTILPRTNRSAPPCCIFPSQVKHMSFVSHLNTLHPRREPSTGWRCHSTGAGGARQY